MSYAVTARVTKETKDAFDAYADNLGLEASALAKLLLKRECRHGQLAAAVKAGRIPIASPQSSRGSALRTITAHFSSSDAVKEFDGYATLCGLTRGSAGAWVFARELHERWLENALLRPPGPDQQ